MNIEIYISLSKLKGPQVTVRGHDSRGNRYLKAVPPSWKKFRKLMDWVHKHRQTFRLDEVTSGKGWLAIRLDGGPPKR